MSCTSHLWYFVMIKGENLGNGRKITSRTTMLKKRPSITRLLEEEKKINVESLEYIPCLFNTCRLGNLIKIDYVLPHQATVIEERNALREMVEDLWQQVFRHDAYLCKTCPSQLAFSLLFFCIIFHSAYIFALIHEHIFS